jgi:hypothetical protein
MFSFESWRLLLYLVCPSRMPGDKYVAIFEAKISIFTIVDL